MDRASEVIRLLGLSASYRDPNAGRCHITGLEHMLRCATLAQNDTDEAQFVALIHDAARPLSDPYHGEVMAEIVRDRVSENGYQTLRTHGAYQAAIVHGSPIDTTTPWHLQALALSRREEASFTRNWARNILTFAEAIGIIRRWLGAFI